MKRKIFVAIFIGAFFTLIGSSLIKRPTIQLKNLSQNEVLNLILKNFQEHETYQRKFSLSDLPQYEVDRTLIDPAFSLPHYFIYPFEAISAFAKAESNCQNIQNKIFKNLPEKFSLWLILKCDKKYSVNFITMYPFMHPSGVSFAQLLKKEMPNENNEILSKYNHILENEDFDKNQIWALINGIRLIRNQNQIWIKQETGTEQDSINSQYLIYSKSAFEQFVGTYGFKIENSIEKNLISFPAFRLEEIEAQDKFGILRERLKVGSIAILLCLLFFTLFELFRIRLKDQKRRTFSFQLLAHELRTPVAALKIEIENLLQRYDDLPIWAQGKVMRFADNLDRLVKVVKASDNYIHNQNNFTYLKLPEDGIDSVNDMMQKIVETFNENVQVHTPDYDCGLNLDLYWVSFCISNLISNGLQHGKAPVLVNWKKINDSIEFTVIDQGTKLETDPRLGQNSTTTQGLRIGLQMVDRITRELGGKLAFKSNPTKWTLSFTKVIK